ncbi:MAG: STAS domain-containing protein [Actinobacteria bacterium]|nr:STAS domain-containing protein [Actinomycetota bacterium]
MQVSSKTERGRPLVVVRGEIDHGNSSDLQAEIDKYMQGGETTLLLDLTDVTYIDSGGVSVLLSTVRKLREHGWLGAIRPNADVRRLIEIVGLKADNGFRIFEDLDSVDTPADKAAVAEPATNSGAETTDP